MKGTAPGMSSEERILTTIACHSAVKLGDKLSYEEMRALMPRLQEGQEGLTQTGYPASTRGWIVRRGEVQRLYLPARRYAEGDAATMRVRFRRD
jgi:hypothetical protein